METIPGLLEHHCQKCWQRGIDLFLISKLTKSGTAKYCYDGDPHTFSLSAIEPAQQELANYERKILSELGFKEKTK